jgi:tetratricopeptide (TPR) repeat protein
MKRLKINIFFLSLFLLLQQSGLSQQLNLKNLQTLRRTGEAFERAGQFDKAADFYIRAVRANPADIGAYLGARRSLDQLQQYDRFEQLLRELEAKRRDIRYRVDLAWIQYKRGDESRAFKMWNTILRENPQDQQAYSLISQIYVENQLYEDAIDVYLTGRKALKNDTLFMFDLAHIYKILNEQEKIVDEYLEYLAVHPQHISFMSVDVQQFVQSTEDVHAFLKSLNKALKSPGEVEWAIHLFLGDAYTIKQDYEKALLHFTSLEQQIRNSDLNKTIPAFEQGKYLYEFANTTLEAGAIDFSEKALSTIINNFPDSKYLSAAKLGVAKVYANQQNFEKAIDALQLFVDSNKRSNETRLALLQIGDIALYNLFDVERAKQSYQRALEEFPHAPFQIEALFRLTECAIADDDLQNAERYLQESYKKSSREIPFKGACLIKLAQLEFYRMHPSASLSYLEEFSESDLPRNQANVLENDALELSMLLQENRNDSTGLAVLGKSSLLLKQRKYENARELLSTHVQEHPNSVLRSELRLQLADVLRKLSDYEPAISVLDSVYADSTSFYRDMALLNSASIYEQDVDSLALAQQRYEKILMEFPNSIYVEKARERVRKLEELK